MLISGRCILIEALDLRKSLFFVHQWHIRRRRKTKVKECHFHSITVVSCRKETKNTRELDCVLELVPRYARELPCGPQFTKKRIKHDTMLTT